MTFPRSLLPFAASLALVAGCGDAPSAKSGTRLPDSPDGTVKTVANELAAGNTAVVWDAMPKGYQEDLTAIVRAFGEKVDAEIYNRAFELIDRAGGVMARKKDLLSRTRFGGAPNASPEKTSESLASTARLLETFGDSALATAESLRSIDLRELLADTGEKLLRQADQAARAAGKPSILEQLRQIEVVVANRGENSATVRLSGLEAAPGVAREPIALKKVEGFWLPAGMVEQWEARVSEAKKQLESMDAGALAENKPRVMRMLDTIDGVLAKIESADDPEAMKTALQSAMMPLIGLAMSAQGMLKQAPGMPSLQSSPAKSDAQAKPSPTEAREQAIRDNLRQLASAADQYFLEESARSVKTEKLTGPDAYIEKLTPVAGEAYPTEITMETSELKATLPNGSEIVIDF